MSKPIEVLLIVGPTASGKSQLGMKIAQEYKGEIICADSRTLYKGLDVSTAKPLQQDRALVPHHVVDFLNPDQAYSAAQFKAAAQHIVKDIQSRGRLPIIVGGTGLYIDGFIYDFHFGPVATASKRQQLEGKTLEELTQMLLDREIAIPENNKNKRYLIRALERGKDYSHQKGHISNKFLIIGLDLPKTELAYRIEKRAVEMVVKGALKEAEWLYRTYGYNVPAAKAPFFKAYRPYFDEGVDIASCQQRDIVLNRQLAKRQLTWFRRNSSIHWFSNEQAAYDFVHEKLR